MGLIKKLRASKKDAGPNEKPAMVKTHLRDMIIVPEMIGSVVGVYVSGFSTWCELDKWSEEMGKDRNLRAIPHSRALYPISIFAPFDHPD